MIKASAIMITALCLATPVAAQQAWVINNPCERGPVPHWKMINSSKAQFADFIQQVRPAMPRDVATLIAHEVCDDMNLVADSNGLTHRLSVLIKQSGY